MNEEKKTPEQEEVALYEQAIQLFGTEDRVLRTIEALNSLASNLLTMHLYSKGVTDCGAMRCHMAAVNDSRAHVDVMLAQLDLILGDNSDDELETLAELRRKVDRAIKRA